MKSNYIIKEKIIDLIEQEPLLKGSSIVVDVDSNIIFLTGCVDHNTKKEILLKLINQINSAMPIVDNVSLTSTPSKKNSDIEIVRLIGVALKKNLGEASYTVLATSKGGLVEISGDVKWNYQKDLAAECIAGIQGIKGITNKIIATPLRH